MSARRGWTKEDPLQNGESTICRDEDAEVEYTYDPIEVTVTLGGERQIEFEFEGEIAEAAPGMGGSPDDPAARFLYETSSTDAGCAAGYPVSVDLLWVGEYQVRVIDGVSTNWARFASTLDVVTTDSYEVVEVRSRLSG